jgi:hypothetical protein
MKPAMLSSDEQEQIRKALSYWVTHWDWECPTLFGIQLEELQVVLAEWPRPLVPEHVAAMATIGALRELLHGASTPPRSEIPRILGIEYEVASALCDKVCALYRN